MSRYHENMHRIPRGMIGSGKFPAWYRNWQFNYNPNLARYHEYFSGLYLS